jgi:hypothetical protein
MKNLSINNIIAALIIIGCLTNPKNISAEEVSISNNKFIIIFNTNKGTWNCSTVTGDKIISNAQFLIITEKGEKYSSSLKKYEKSVQKSDIDDIMGKGQKLEIRFAPREKDLPEAVISLCLFEEKSYMSLEIEAINNTSDKIIIKEIQPVRLDSKKRGNLYFKGTSDKLSCLIDGYSPGNESKLIFLKDQKNISGYTTAALYHAESKKSLIFGFLQNHKSFNLIAMDLSNKKSDEYSSFDFTASSYFVHCPLKPGESVTTGRILIDLPENVFDGLERYADLVAKMNNIILDKKPLCGWCSWYYIYPDITEEEVIMNLNFLADNLKDYGLEYIQIDRGRIPTGTDWLTTNSKFPHGMIWLADQIHSKGLKAGIWTAPFWLGRESKAYNEDWILKKISTEPKQEGKRRRHWASWGDVLDSSNEEVIDYMKNFVSVLVDDWGYDYLKNDFLQYGLPEIRNLDKILLKKGEIKDVKKIPRKNINITPVEAFKNGVSAVKEAAGDETFIMGCGAPLFYTAGYSHSCRIGGDIQSKLCVSWECGTSKTVRTSAKRYYYNGRIMWIDPDCLVIGDPCRRGSFTYEQAKSRAVLACLFGGMMMTSDRMYTLPPEKIDMLKRVMPPYAKTARPLDLFEKQLPEVWLWEIEKDFGKWHVLSVFNYDTETITREISYEYLGMDPSKEYILYDFWKGKMPTRSSRYYYRTLMPFANEIFFEIAPMSCFVVAIHEKQPRPQVISTSRHITQGAMDLEDVKWDEKNLKLSGISQIVKNDNYEIVVTIPENFKFVKADADVSVEAHLDDPDVDRYTTVRINLKSPESRKVNWSVSLDQN